MPPPRTLLILALVLVVPLASPLRSAQGRAMRLPARTVVVARAAAAPGQGRACNARATVRRRHRAGRRARSADACRSHVRRRHRHGRRGHRHTVSQTPADPVLAPVPSTSTPSPALACAGADLVPVEANLQAVTAATLCLVNRERAARGLGALADHPQLAQAALRHGRDMIANHYFGHQGPAGDTAVSRIRDSGFIVPGTISFEVGENIAWGTGTKATATEIVAGWIASPEHRANILDPNYVYSGISVEPSVPGVLSAGLTGATVTQDFGVASGS